MMQVESMHRPKCTVFNCENDAVRVLKHKLDQTLTMQLCAYHVQRMFKYLDNEKVRELIWPNRWG